MVAAVFFASLINWATVALGVAPIFSQCSSRSCFKVTLAGVNFGSEVPISSLNLPSRGLRESVATT